MSKKRAGAPKEGATATEVATEPAMDLIAVVREQLIALEAAVAVVLAAPEEKAVHRLRTGTRRVEAQCELLALVSPLGLPDALPGAVPHILGETKKLRKLLREVRRSAGKVRDLDVQMGTIQEVAAPEQPAMEMEARKLLKVLKSRRKTRAAALLADLEGHGRRLAPHLEKLREALGDLPPSTVSSQQLAGFSQGWFQQRAEQQDLAQEEGLHGVRKAAKLTRYMLECNPDNAAAARLGAHFEAIQEAGGTWHDNLTLREIAQGRLGKKSVLAGLFAEREEQALSVFRAKLQPAAVKE